MSMNIKSATLVELLNYDSPSYFELSMEEKRKHIMYLKNVIEPVLDRVSDNHGTSHVYINILRTCNVEELIELANIFPIPRFYHRIMEYNSVLSEEDKVYLALAGIA